MSTMTSDETMVIPDHVPAHLVRDFNYFEVEGAALDPHMAWKRVQDQEPDIFWTPHYGGHWVVTRGRDLKAIVGDHETFSSRKPGLGRGESWVQPAPVGYDPPDHTRLKQMGIPRFSPRTVRTLEQGIRELADDLIDKFIDQGRCDFVGDFGLPLPTHTFMKFAGLPMEDLPMLLRFVEDKMRNRDREVQSAAALGLDGYARKVVAARLEEPGGDFVSDLVHAAPGGVKASYDELVGWASLLWSAGLDTVASSMGFMVRFLAENPGHRQQLLDDPTLIPKAVEEFLRRFGVSQVARVVTRETVLNGITMKEGDMVQIATPLHGLDERVFERPLEVDFSRPDAAQSMAFGSGIHRCIGSFLARTELRIGLEIWLTRIPNFSLDREDPPVGTTGLVNALRKISLVWEG